MDKAQGALEYLLLIGGVILVAVIAISIIIALTTSSEGEAISATADALCSKFPPSECSLHNVSIKGQTFFCQLFAGNRCRSSGLGGVDGLVLLFHMDDGAPEGVVTDDSGLLNNGEIVNNVDCSVAGVSGTLGCQFGGVNDYIKIAESSGTSIPNNVTVSACIKVTTTDTSGATIVTPGDNWGLAILPPPSGNVRFFKSLGDQSFFGIATDGENATTFTPVNVLDNAWHHIAVVQSSTGMTIYVDGVVKASNSDARNIVYDQFIGVRVGRDGFFDGGQDFSGVMDEVSIWSKALTPSEISSLAGECV